MSYMQNIASSTYTLFGSLITKLRFQSPPLFVCIFFISAGAWFTSPPHGLTIQAWHLLIIFLMTLVSFINRLLSNGAVALIAIAIGLATKTVAMKQVLSGFGSEVVWLVVFAFFIARAIIKTGLGSRIAYSLISVLGKSTLGLSYGLITADILLALVVPSNTARGAGILYPILNSLTQEYKSLPHTESRKRIGAYLTQLCFHSNTITSSMFMTALASNPIAVTLSMQFDVKITWMSWAISALIPGLVSLIFFPLILYWLYPPILTHTPQAPIIAQKKLKEIGPLTQQQYLMIVSLIALVLLWVFGPIFDLSALTSTFIIVAALLGLNVLDWKDIIEEGEAWSTLIWFSLLLLMASSLKEYGFFDWMNEHIQESANLSHWAGSLFILLIIYFYSHYLFASVTAHVLAMFTCFVALALSAGAPPMLTCLLFSILSGLSGCLTHYGNGSAPVYFGSGFVTFKEWWKLGAMMGIIHLILWSSLGLLWWKFLGIW